MPPLADLPAAYLAVERERDELRSANGALKDEVATLRWQLEKLRKVVFGPGKNEKLDRAQLTLALKELEAAVAAAERPAQAVSYERRAPAAAAERRAAEKQFEKLPVQEVVVIEPEAVKADPEAYEKISEERTFEVEIVAPAPARAVPGGHASAGLLAWPSIWTTCRSIGRKSSWRAGARRSPVPPCASGSASRPSSWSRSTGRCCADC
jgi:hypothetical protein